MPDAIDNETKEDKLKHYAKRRLKRFTQYDGFYLPEGGDDLIRPDNEDHWISGGLTNELMSGEYDVRVLVTEGADKEQVVALLLKIATWIQTGGYPLELKPANEIKLDFTPNRRFTVTSPNSKIADVMTFEELNGDNWPGGDC